MTSKPKNKKSPRRTTRAKATHCSSSKRVIVGVEDRIHKSDDYDQFDRMPPFAIKVDPSIPLGNEETPYIRHDHDQGTFVKKRNFNIVL
jgi:hypothetical protein